MSLKDFRIEEKLGEGAYSTVYKVVRIADNACYALKRVKMINLTNKQKQNALNQIRILASINSPNIVGYREAFVDESSKSLCIVMEFADNGDLQSKIKQLKNKQISISEDEAWSILIQMLKGLKQLHDLNIFHRDLKPANIFMYTNGAIKLGDLNVSKISQHGLCMTQTGTPYYASPEVWKDQPYDQKSDLWSLGCVLYELLTLSPPFQAQDMEGLYKKVVRGIYPKIVGEYSQDLSTVIRLLLQVNPDLRPSCEKILKMGFIQKKIKDENKEYNIKAQLLKTIKPTDSSLKSITDLLPKPNYGVYKSKKTKLIKNVMDMFEHRQSQYQSLATCDVESLPLLQKQKKLHPLQNSQRLAKQKNSIIASRSRKKSQMSYSRSGAQIQIKISQLEEIKELKLPKVQNRYSKMKEKLVNSKQNSLRCHKNLEYLC